MEYPGRPRLWNPRNWSKDLVRHIGALGFALIAGVRTIAVFAGSEWRWYHYGALTALLLAAGAVGMLDFAEERGRYPKLRARPAHLSRFNLSWLNLPGHVAVVTRDFSWVRSAELDIALRRKAERHETTLILPRPIEASEELARHGAEVIYYPELRYDMRTRFSVSRVGAHDSRVLFHRQLDDGTVEFFERTPANFPEYWLAQDFVEIFRRLAREGSVVVQGPQVAEAQP